MRDPTRPRRPARAPRFRIALAGLLLSAPACRSAERAAAPPANPSTKTSINEQARVGALAATPLRAVPYRYRQVAIGGGGYVTGIVVHPRVPELIYLRTDVGGAYRYDPEAQRWLPLLDGFDRRHWHQYGVESLAVDPQDPEVLYAALGKYLPRKWLALPSAVYKSKDRGRTWAATGLAVAMGGNEDWRWAGERLAVDPRDGRIVYFGSRSDGLYRSLDGGASFQPVTSFPTRGAAERGLSFVHFDPQRPVIYVGAAGSGVYRSRDAGASWQLLPHPKLAKNPQRAAIASDGTLYVSFLGEGNDPGGVVRYRKDRAEVVTPPGTWDYCGIAVDPADPAIVMAAPISDDFPTPLFRSTSAGASWSALRYQRKPDVPWWPARFFTGHTSSLVIDPTNAKRVLYSDYYGVWRTDDITQSPAVFATSESGHEETEAFVLRSPPIGPVLISGVADVDGFVHHALDAFPKSRLNGPAAADGDTTGLDYCEKDPRVLARVGYEQQTRYGIAFSSDSGATWTRPPGLPFPEARRGRVAVSAADCSHVVWVPERAAPYRSLDGGASFEKSRGAPEQAIDDRWNYSHPLASDRVDGSLFYLYLGGGFYASPDGGASWARRASLPAPPYDHNTGIPGPAVKAVPGRRGEVFVSLHEGGLYYSRDAGGSFEKLPRLALCQLFALGKPLSPAGPPTLYVYGTLREGDKELDGIFRSADLGQSFERIDDPAQPLGDQAMVMEADPRVAGRVYIATNGRGTFWGEPLSAQ